MTKNTTTAKTAAFDLGVIATKVSAADKRSLDTMAQNYAAGVDATHEINKAMQRIVKAHGFEALAKGTANPKVAIDSDQAITAERKAKKANPYLRYLYLAVMAMGRDEGTARNLAGRVKKCAAAGVLFGDEPKGGKGKVKGKGEPALRVMMVNQPDELTAAMGLQEWLSKQQEAYPELAAFLTPALRAYLGDAADDVQGDDAE